MKHYSFFFAITLILSQLSLLAQNTCFENEISFGDISYEQGSYFEARLHYVAALQCENSIQSDAQQRIDACDKMIGVQKEAAERGNANDQYQLGLMYYYYINEKEEDKREAVKWFRRAAEQGHSGAECMLGDVYDYGYGIDKDEVEAMKWYLKAANQGNALAQYRIGYKHMLGNGVEQDNSEAAKWLIESVSQDDCPVLATVFLFQIGADYYEKQYYKEAFKCWEVLAEKGGESAQYNLGIMYENGLGVDVNYQNAAKWYRKAAEQGYADAQNNLGVLYQSGHGVNKDYAEAVKWFREAAKNGSTIAQQNLKDLGETW